MAYYANKRMFDEIDQIVFDYGCRMSLWVNDIIISGDKAVKASWETRKIIVKHGLAYNKKFKIYQPSDNKKRITGIILNLKEAKLKTEVT